MLTAAFRHELARGLFLCVQRQAGGIPSSLDLTGHVLGVYGRLTARAALLQLLTVERPVVFQLLVQGLNLLEVRGLQLLDCLQFLFRELILVRSKCLAWATSSFIFSLEFCRVKGWSFLLFVAFTVRLFQKWLIARNFSLKILLYVFHAHLEVHFCDYTRLTTFRCKWRFSWVRASAAILSFISERLVNSLRRKPLAGVCQWHIKNTLWCCAEVWDGVCSLIL